jgi:SAM-dependent methyltransferase
VTDPDLSRWAKTATFDSSLAENMEILAGMDRYYRWIADSMRPFVGQRVLDLGCGSGSLLQFFRDKEQLVGIDVSADCIDAIRQRMGSCPHFHGELLDITDADACQRLRPHAIESIITMNTLEHIRDDAKAFRHLYDVLPPGGSLVIVVPASMRLYSILDYETGHFRRYEPDDLREKLQRAGFVLQHMRRLNLPGAVGWWIGHVVLRRRIYSPLSFRLYNALAPAFRWVEQRIEPPFGLSLFCVAGRR